MNWRTSGVAIISLSLSSCFGLIDNGTDHIVDDYKVTWIDLHAHRALYYVTKEIVPAYVAAVGYNSDYLFVKQHPLSGELDSEVQESVTHYWLKNIK